LIQGDETDFMLGRTSGDEDTEEFGLGKTRGNDEHTRNV